MIKNLFVSILIFIAYFCVSLPIYSGDVNNHIVWGRSIIYQGSIGFYQREFHDYSFPNYPPVSMLGFAASAWIFDNLVNGVNSIHFGFWPHFGIMINFLHQPNTIISFLKITAIIPVILLAFILTRLSIFDEFKLRGSQLFWLVILNPGIIYLAAVWGQNDLLQVMFIQLAFLLILQNNKRLSILSGALSILSKQTTLVLWFALQVIIYKKYGFKQMIVSVLINLVVMFILYLPFNNTSISWPFTFYLTTLKTTGYLVADNAINFWALVVNFANIDASTSIGFFTYEQIGLLLFGLISAPTLWLFLKSKFKLENMYLMLFLLSGSYFFILTRMHERYLIPTVVFAIILSVINRKYWINLIFFSFLILLNMYRGLYQPGFWLFDDLANSKPFLSFLVICYGLILVGNYYWYFRLNPVTKKIFNLRILHD